MNGKQSRMIHEIFYHPALKGSKNGWMLLLFLNSFVYGDSNINAILFSYLFFVLYKVANLISRSTAPRFHHHQRLLRPQPPSQPSQPQPPHQPPQPQPLRSQSNLPKHPIIFSSFVYYIIFICFYWIFNTYFKYGKDELLCYNQYPIT
jgi:hypothetical protein